MQEYRVLALRALNNVLLSENNTPIDPRTPVWTASASVPVAFQIDEKNAAQFEVELSSLPELDDSAMLQAVGSTKDVLFSGSIEGSLVTVNGAITPSSFSVLSGGAVHWEIVQGDDTIIPLCTMELELYWLYLDSSTPTRYRKGVAVEGLRFMREMNPAVHFPAEAESKGMNTAVPSVAKIITDAFNYFPPCYDIWNGAPHFVDLSGGWNNITLHLTAFLHAHNTIPNSILNCYDTASVAQHCLAYNNYSTTFCYMSPFGYLAKTPLIGRGYCNNPLYGKTHGTPVIDPKNPSRTAFDNHAFIMIKDLRIADSCVGPHIGNENIDQYIASATDSVYPDPPAVRRGTSADVSYYLGVTHVDFIASAKVAPKTESVREFKTMLNYEELADSSGKNIVGKWPHPSDSGVFSSDWETFHEEIVPGADEILKMWMLRGDKGTASVKLFVGSVDKQLSHNRFLNMGTLHQSVDNPFESVDDELGEYAVITKNEAYSRCIVLFQNSLLEITIYDTELDVLALAKYYYNWAKENEVDELNEYLPKMDIDYAKVDQYIEVSLSGEENTQLEFEDDEGAYRLMRMEDKSIVLEPQDKDGQLKILVIDKDTLLVNSTHI